MNSSQKVILCGGPDRCGKTNILHAIAQVTGIPYFKASNEHLNFMSSQDRFINELRFSDFKMVDFLKQTKHSVLIDRAYMCEYAYSKFFNRQTDIEALKDLDAKYASFGAKILICTRKSFVGIQDDLNPKLDSAALEKISNLYEEFSLWTKCKTYTLHVDDEDLFREVDEVLEFMGYDRISRLSKISQLSGEYNESRNAK